MNHFKHLQEDMMIYYTEYIIYMRVNRACLARYSSYGINNRIQTSLLDGIKTIARVYNWTIKSKGIEFLSRTRLSYLFIIYNLLRKATARERLKPAADLANYKWGQN